MPRRCCVPGCGGNSKREYDAYGTLATFNVPKDPVQQQQWFAVIPRKDLSPEKQYQVCIRHFWPEDYVQQRNKHRLKPNAIPSIFGKIATQPPADNPIADVAVDESFDEDDDDSDEDRDYDPLENRIDPPNDPLEDIASSDDDLPLKRRRRQAPKEKVTPATKKSTGRSTRGRKATEAKAPEVKSLPKTFTSKLITVKTAAVSYKSSAGSALSAGNYTSNRRTTEEAILRAAEATATGKSSSGGVVRRAAVIDTDDLITDFDDFLENLAKNIDLTLWRVMQTENMIVLYIIAENYDVGCEMSVRVVINFDMMLKSLLGEKTILKDYKVNSWTQLKCLLDHHKTKHTVSYTYESDIERAAVFLERASEVQTDEKSAKRLEFLIDQVKMLLPNKPPGYSKLAMTVAKTVFCSDSGSPTQVYRKLLGYVNLPTVRHMQQLSPINQAGVMANISGYITPKATGLSEQEKYVSLLIDDLQAPSGVRRSKPGSTRKFGTVTLRKMFSFMIKSIYGTYRAVVRIAQATVPIEFSLKQLTLDAIRYVQQAGFRVVAIVSDNKYMKQNLYRSLGGKNMHYFSNPSVKGEKIFLIYNAAHLYNALRNNWLNVNTADNTFMYPDPLTYEVKYATFQKIRQLYNQEMNATNRKAYMLDFKSVTQWNIEGQRVRMCDNVFHQSTVDALQDNNRYCETAEFCTTIRRWWGIVNAKDHSQANLQERTKALENFVAWLTIWRDTKNNPGALNEDTCRALIWTTQSLIDVMCYALQTLQLPLISPGAFQTEDFETRMYLYRTVKGFQQKILYRPTGGLTSTLKLFSFDRKRNRIRN